MRRAAVLAVLALVSLPVLAATAAVPAGAHSFNYVAADAQLTPDGTVVVEAAYVQQPGWLVLYPAGEDVSDASTSPGAPEPIGHVRLPRANHFYADVRVAIEERVWRNFSGNRTVRVVLHGDDGDGRFEPAADRKLASFGRIAAVEITVGRHPARAVVTAEGDFSQRVSEPRVTVRRVALPRDGFVVLRYSTADGPGDVVGVRRLSAGVHQNVSVKLDESFYRTRDVTFALWAVAVLDDGDGTFDEGDRPVEVNGARVMTEFGVRKLTGGEGGGSVVVTASPTATPTRTTEGAPGFGLAVALAATAIVVAGGALAMFARR